MLSVAIPCLLLAKNAFIKSFKSGFRCIASLNKDQLTIAIAPMLIKSLNYSVTKAKIDAGRLKSEATQTLGEALPSG